MSPPYSNFDYSPQFIFSGGGALTANSVDGSHITNGSITEADILDGTITQTKLATAVQTKLDNPVIADGSIIQTKLATAVQTKLDNPVIADGSITQTKLATAVQTKLDNPVIADGSITQTKLATAFLNRIYNLEYPGFYGSLKIQNSNTSGVGSSITFTLNSQNITGVIQLLGSTTLTNNQHIDVPILIQNRLLNKDTSFNIVYSTTSTSITSTIPTGVSVITPIVSPNIYFSVLPAFIHNGTIQLGIVLPAPPASATGWYGNIIMALVSYRGTGINTTYNYTIYKGSTIGSAVLATQSINNSVQGSTVSQTNTLAIGDRLANSSSTILIVINNFDGGDFFLQSISGATQNGELYLPSAIGTNIVLTYSIEPP